MKIKWGALVVDGRNKIGGHVASKNRAGAYLRTKVTPVNPESLAQLNVRNRLSGISSAWRGLLPAERRAWNAAVADYAKTDIFGDLKNPSGFNLHQMLNNNLLNIYTPVITTPPLPKAVLPFTAFTFTVAKGTPALSLVFAPAIDTNHDALVLATPGLSPGVSFVKSEFRQITVLNYTHTSAHDGLAAYVAKFGAIPAAGTKIFMKLVMINITTGQAGLPISASYVVDV